MKGQDERFTGLSVPTPRDDSRLGDFQRDPDIFMHSRGFYNKDLMVYFAPFPLLVDGDDTRVGVVGRNRNLGTRRHKLLPHL